MQLISRIKTSNSDFWKNCKIPNGNIHKEYRLTAYDSVEVRDLGSVAIERIKFKKDSSFNRINPQANTVSWVSINSSPYQQSHWPVISLSEQEMAIASHAFKLFFENNKDKEGLDWVVDGRTVFLRREAILPYIDKTGIPMFGIVKGLKNKYIAITTGELIVHVEYYAKPIAKKNIPRVNRTDEPTGSKKLPHAMFWQAMEVADNQLER